MLRQSGSAVDLKTLLQICQNDFVCRFNAGLATKAQLLHWLTGCDHCDHLHLGIYAYRWNFLADFTSWPPSSLEKTEKLEQLRALEHGARIYVLTVDRATHGIDTPEQYAAFVKRFKGQQ